MDIVTRIDKRKNHWIGSNSTTNCEGFGILPILWGYLREKLSNFSADFALYHRGRIFCTLLRNIY
eukprot:1394405-Amorphochlora_amoeboformis.AAC.2